MSNIKHILFKIEYYFLTCDRVRYPGKGLNKADPIGVFTYAIQKIGYWIFAAFNMDEVKIKRNGQAKPIDIGAVFWV